MHFFCFLNIFLAAKLREWRLFWVKNENGHGGLDFCATTSFFSKINVTFLDVWMILIELFDISVSFRFQNFPRTNFSRYGGLYGSIGDLIQFPCIWKTWFIKRLHLGSHSLHIPATLSATMWAEFRKSSHILFTFQVERRNSSSKKIVPWKNIW